ncbi:MAG: hypothetical protein JXA20_15490, partial [Spirochaetes bacterium]|nr:hypothetical protein [Spirochaetota bacterium]
PGWARGYAPYPYAPYPGQYGEMTPEREIEALRGQTDFFQNQVNALNERIRELEEIALKKRGDAE